MVATKGTIAKPPPPPKPSHLSVALTGTLSSEAFRDYVRQCEATLRDSKQRKRWRNVEQTARDEKDTQEEEDDRNDADRNDAYWRTAKPFGECRSVQPESAPASRPHYPSLAQLFSTQSGESTLCRTTKRMGEESEFAESKKDKMKLVEERCHSVRTTRSSTLIEERSREPSIVSRPSLYVLCSSQWDDSENLETEIEGTKILEDTFAESIPAEEGRVRCGDDGSSFERAGPFFTANKEDLKSHSDILLLRPMSQYHFSSSRKERGQSIIDHKFQSEAIKRVSIASLDKSSRTTYLRGREARALYAFDGEASFNELSLGPGQVFDVLEEEVGGGWSLALIEDSFGRRRKGLVPRGWYAYIQEFTRYPQTNPMKKSAPHEAPSLLLDEDAFERPYHEEKVRSTKSADITPIPLFVPSSAKARQYKEDSLQEMWIQTRPASGVGQMSDKLGEGAVQALTMVKSKSEEAATFNKSNILPRSLPLTSVEMLDKNGRDESHVQGSSDSGAPSPITMSPAKATHTSWKVPSLLGGRTMNRFTPFVTSGVEEFLLVGNSLAPRHDTLKHEILSGHHGGPSWKSPGFCIHVEIHTPELLIDDRGAEFVAYVVHSSYTLFPDREADADIASSEDPWMDPNSRPQEATYTSSVYRRFNQFKWLSKYINNRFAFLFLSLPPLPSANHGASKMQHFDALFVEKRRKQLEVWLMSVVRHPVLRSDERVRWFLDNELWGEEWVKGANEFSSSTNAPMNGSAASFFSKCYHPLFNFDPTDAVVDTKHLSAFLEAYEKGMGADSTASPNHSVLGGWQQLREHTRASSDLNRQLSYSLLRLLTGTHTNNVSGSSTTSQPQTARQFAELPPMGKVGKRDERGATNEERAWCWRPGCTECRSLTLTLQMTAETFQAVADIYDSHAHGAMLELHERFWNAARIRGQSTSLIDIQETVSEKYRNATGEVDSLLEDEPPLQHGEDQADEQTSGRYETVLNITMSESDRIHRQRVEDWRAAGRSLLDGQIGLYEDLLLTLKRARARFDEELEQGKKDKPDQGSTGPILPSPYEAELDRPVQSEPLVLPSTNLVPPSKASHMTRPISLAGEVISGWFGGSKLYHGPPSSDRPAKLLSTLD